VTPKPPAPKRKTPAKRTTPSERNPAVLAAAILGGVVLVALLLLFWLRRSGPPTPPRGPAPAEQTAPATTPFAPVYGGGAPAGRPRAGF
jgi:hypothetical protein